LWDPIIHVVVLRRLYRGFNQDDIFIKVGSAPLADAGGVSGGGRPH